MHRKTELCTEKLSYAPKDRFLEHNSYLKNITRRLKHNSIIARTECTGLVCSTCHSEKHTQNSNTIEPWPQLRFGLGSKLSWARLTDRQLLGQFLGQLQGRIQGQFKYNFKDSFKDNFKEIFKEKITENFQVIL